MAVRTDNLALEYVAKLATGSGPGVNGGSPTTTWVANVGDNDITLQNTGGNFGWTTSSGWAGDGSAGDPYCLCADGTGDYGTFASTIVGSDADFTVEFWTYMADGPPAVNSSFLFNVASYTGLRYHVNTSGIGTWTVGKGSVSYTYTADTGLNGYGAAWQQHALTYNAATDSLIPYRNGAASHAAYSVTFGAYTGACRLFATDSSMNAMKLATLRVYSSCLSPDDVAANYAAGVTAASTDGAAPAFTGVRITHHIAA